MIEKNARLVFSTDPEVNKKCLKCKELISECICKGDEDATLYKGPANLRIEKKGRGGKTVTVVAKLPKNLTYLKNLTALLKKKCGAGGTFLVTSSEGLIEIQGDKKEAIKAALEKEGITVKG
jgi:translation initiation factor 1